VESWVAEWNCTGTPPGVWNGDGSWAPEAKEYRSAEGRDSRGGKSRMERRGAEAVKKRCPKTIGNLVRESPPSAKAMPGNDTNRTVWGKASKTLPIPAKPTHQPWGHSVPPCA